MTNKGRPSFSFGDFKKWMEEESVMEKASVDGKKVQAAVSAKRLINRVEADQGDITESVRSFVKHGGTVISHDGEYLLIDAGLGTFYCHRRNVR